MGLFLQFFLSGLTIGGVYGLVALGIVVIFKATKVLHFAQGYVAMIGGYFCWSMLAQIGIPLVPAILLTAAFGFTLGIIIDYSIMRPLIGQPLLSLIMVTIALTAVFEGLQVVIWPGAIKSFIEYVPAGTVTITGASISLQYVMGFAVALVLFGILSYYFYRTKHGLAMRATAEDHQLARSAGISVEAIFSQAWGIATLLGVMAGVLLGMATSVGPEIASIGFACFAVVFLGGLESIKGCIIAGPIVGVVQYMAMGYLDPVVGGGLSTVVPFVLIMLVLLVKPFGLFGEIRIERL